MEVCYLLQNRWFCPTSKSAVLSHFRNRRFCPIFKIGCFVSFKVGWFVLTPGSTTITLEFLMLAAVSSQFSSHLTKRSFNRTLKHAKFRNISFQSKFEKKTQKGDLNAIFSLQEPQAIWTSIDCWIFRIKRSGTSKTIEREGGFFNFFTFK